MNFQAPDRNQKNKGFAYLDIYDWEHRSYQTGHGTGAFFVQ